MENKTNHVDDSIESLLIKVLLEISRTLTKDRINKIVHDGSLKKILRTMGDDAEWENLLHLVEGRKKAIPTGAYARVNEYFFSGSVKKGMIREKKGAVLFTAKAGVIFLNINQQTHTSTKCRSLDINVEPFEKDIVKAGRKFSNTYEISGLMSRLIQRDQDGKKNEPGLSKSRLNRFPCEFLESTNQVAQLRWEKGFKSWILDIVEEGDLLYPYKNDFDSEKIRLFFE